MSIKKHLINVKTFIHSDGESDKINFETKAYFKYINGKYFIKYFELKNHNLGKKETTIEVNGETQVILKRDGEHGHTFLIEEDKDHLTEYKTSHGAIAMVIKGDKIRNSLTSEGGEIYFKYSILVDNIKLSDNEIFINIRRIR